LATYKEIQSEVRNRFLTYVRSCWIAEIKALYGLTRRIAHNRISPSGYKHPCPVEKRSMIETVLRHFQMIN